MLLKRLQLALIHTAVAMTLVPLTGTLNRVMIFEFGLSKTIFTLLAIFPYLFFPFRLPSAPLQTVLPFSDIVERRIYYLACCYAPLDWGCPLIWFRSYKKTLPPVS